MMKLVAPPLANNDSLSFDNDLLNRKDFGERMVGLVRSASTGVVLALDAPWGEGKTTFVKMWQRMLDDQKIPCVYLDAFEQDQVDDPFLPLVATIVEFAEKHASKDNNLQSLLSSMKKNAGRVGVKFLGWAAKVGVRAGTLGILNHTDIGALKNFKDDIAKDSASAAEAVIASHLARFSSDKATLTAFRNDLTNLVTQIAANSEAPLVFVIDELDRCRPDFAVTLIERIKHVLDVPGIAFLFVLHRSQLEEAVRGIYGPGIDASGYLAKFIHVWCSLPKRRGPRRNTSDYQKYCNALYDAHAITTSPDDEDVLRTALPDLSQLFDMSLREMERLFTNIVVFYSAASKRLPCVPDLTCALAIIRIRYPAVFARLREQQIGYREFEAAVPELKQISEDSENVKYVQISFKYCLMTDEELLTLSENPDFKYYGRELARNATNRQSLLPLLCKHFDMFSVE